MIKMAYCKTAVSPALGILQSCTKPPIISLLLIPVPVLCICEACYISWAYCYVKYIEAKTKWLPFCSGNFLIIIKKLFAFLFGPLSAMNNNLPLVHIIAWRRSHYTKRNIYIKNAYMHHSALMSYIFIPLQQHSWLVTKQRMIDFFFLVRELTKQIETSVLLFGALIVS